MIRETAAMTPRGLAETRPRSIANSDDRDERSFQSILRVCKNRGGCDVTPMTVVRWETARIFRRKTCELVVQGEDLDIDSGLTPHQ